MIPIKEVTLELLRIGDLHNQLLSPYTPYTALCADGSPVTFQVNLEHHELLNRLARLRYITSGSSGTIAVSDQMREAEVVSLGKMVGSIFRDIPGLGAELSPIQDADNQLINLKLIISGSELALLPFELVTAPKGFPGEGLPLLIQGNVAIVLTREIRRHRPTPVQWNRPPKILFISAQPGQMSVPEEAHLYAIREALEPYIQWAENPENRLRRVKNSLTVLRNASLDAIRDACSKDEYTHVHILAHGHPFEEAGEKRWGLALCAEANPSAIEIISGRQLALALRGKTAVTGTRPSVVNLMTCDSGNVGSTLIPGGSIAHELQAFGIPWIIASQFPLTKKGSVIFTRELYERLLTGDDPRQVLYDLRHQLHLKSKKNHDWGSLVIYATVPENFNTQVRDFQERQMRKRIEVLLNKAAQTRTEDDMQAAEAGLEAAFSYCDTFLQSEKTPADRSLRSEWYGMMASSKKRQAVMLYAMKKRIDAKKKLIEARVLYERSFRMDRNNHWTAVQFLSLSAVLEIKVDTFWWGFAYDSAKQDLFRGSPMDQAWAHSSLAELELLRVIHTQKPHQIRKIKTAVRDHCKSIVNLVGSDSFPVYSTWRQFNRYLKMWDRKQWHLIAQAAIKALYPSGETPDESALPPHNG